MIMQTYSVVIRVLILLCICATVPLIACAEENKSVPSSSANQVEVFSGSIPSGDGVVSIKAVSGKFYQVPAMSPLGVIQALAGTDSIESYKIGDELISKRGLLTLDGVNGYVNSGESSWFVLVNEKQLQDYLLPNEEGLNAFGLKPGDKIIFAYGNPTKSSREALASIRVSIGAQTDATTTAKPVSTQTVSSTPTVVPVSTPDHSGTLSEKNTSINDITSSESPVPTVSPTLSAEPTQKEAYQTKDPNKPVYGDSEEEETVTAKETTVSQTKDPNKPVYGDSEEEETVTAEETAVSQTKDPNKPVYGDSEEEETVSAEETAVSQTKDPNKPVYGDSEEEETVSEEETASPSKDQNKPVYDDSENKTSTLPEVTETPTSSETTDEQSEETPSETQTPSANISKSGQHVLYDGSLSVSSGNVNITTSSGMDYEVEGDTPLGILQFLQTDGKISGISINDRGMRKGGILTIDGIGEYQYGNEGWFVQLNDLILQDYMNPGTDGLNIRKVKSGDKVTFFYGKQDQTPTSAKAAIYVTLK
ncbi:MAG: hypothetical protein LUQ50_05490 [Methanospirillum sp.]|uniref:hypothetical protein n=1 Tax=Methanospirillum sp. TaxID=45200 RepID=UPI0023719F55|nr:hypothetical protein [Methanospirillum sp.]MDD1728507.1 hypothetical protein [Methanospirillum sp.]